MNRSIELAKQNIHVLANSITEWTTNTPHAIESRKKTILDIAGQVGRGFQCLLEHSH
ncbi:MAG TPA: hypothetical protein VNO32_34210 [Candidatus Acidoferrum sp.]|nr:hypothetical protein [Candidatus Acidoferrum sp.]